MYVEEWFLEKLLREEAERRQANPGPLLKVPFYTVRSELFEKADIEMRAYEMPISKIIEDNSVKDIRRQVDAKLFEEFYELFFEEK